MIIFDSSTLILLARIDLLGLFIESFQGDVVIPGRVKREVMTGDREETTFIAELINTKKIKVEKVRNTAVVKRLIEDFNIDAGEAEVLALSMEKKAGIVVATDDRNAIRACKLIKKEFITAVAFLIRAVEKGLLDKEEGKIKLLKLQSIGRYRKAIIEDAAKQIEGG